MLRRHDWPHIQLRARHGIAADPRPLKKQNVEGPIRKDGQSSSETGGESQPMPVIGGKFVPFVPDVVLYSSQSKASPRLEEVGTPAPDPTQTPSLPGEEDAPLADDHPTEPATAPSSPSPSDEAPPVWSPSASPDPSSRTSPETTVPNNAAPDTHLHIRTPSPVFGPSPPPKSHFFDTFTLTKRLSSGGFTENQSIAIMHLLRHLLQSNLTLAQQHLVSRSSLENDMYLFKAACGELRTEIQSLRATGLDKMRMERQEVQREFEELNQRFMEEVIVCRNELSSMLNDRKMVNRAEQREVENKIQELSYKITVMITSDLKSEVEKLRWVTTRRGLIAIGILAAFITSLIKVSQDHHKKMKEEAAAAAATAAASAAAVATAAHHANREAENGSRSANGSGNGSGNGNGHGNDGNGANVEHKEAHETPTEVEEVQPAAAVTAS